MKWIADITLIQCSAEHLTVSINHARVLGRLRRTISGFRPARTKIRRLKARLRKTQTH